MSNIILKRIAKINPKFQKGKLFHRDKCHYLTFNSMDIASWLTTIAQNDGGLDPQTKN